MPPNTKPKADNTIKNLWHGFIGEVAETILKRCFQICSNQTTGWTGHILVRAPISWKETTFQVSH